MPCPAFEDRVLHYAELTGAARASVDAHLLTCGECSAFLNALTTVDNELEAHLLSVTARDGFEAAVLAALDTKTTRLPELLDGVAWIAIVCVVAVVAGSFARQIGPLALYVWCAGAAVTVIAALILGFSRLGEARR